MRFKFSLLGACLAVVIYSGVSLFARGQQEASVCCSAQEDCDALGGGKCCDPESVNQPPCSSEVAGLCLPSCIPGRR